MHTLKLRNIKGLKLIHLLKVFEANSGLKHFSYSSYHQDSIGMIIYGQTTRRLKHLEHLHLGCTGNNDPKHLFSKIVNFHNLHSLANLKQMKGLLFDANGLNIENLLAKLARRNTVEVLTIRDASIKIKNYEKMPTFSSLRVFKLYFKDYDDMRDEFFANLGLSLFVPNLEQFDIEYINFSEGFYRHLFLSKFISGLETFLSSARNLHKLLFKIPQLRISVRSFLQLVKMCEKWKRKSKLTVCLLRENITLELSQYLETNGAQFQNIIEFNIMFIYSEYFY